MDFLDRRRNTSSTSDTDAVVSINVASNVPSLMHLRCGLVAFPGRHSCSGLLSSGEE